IDPAQIARTMSERPDKRYIVLARSVREDHEPYIAELQQDRKNYRGLGSDIRLTRDYPQGPVGGQLIGFVGYEGSGLEGVEKLFDKDLAGAPGRRAFLHDAAHRPPWYDRDR